MKRQLQGIALLLMALLLNVSWGNEPIFDLDICWNLIFVLLGAIGVFITFLPFKNKNDK